MFQGNVSQDLMGKMGERYVSELFYNCFTKKIKVTAQRHNKNANKTYYSTIMLEI